jgi:hypothetical protein
MAQVHAHAQAGRPQATAAWDRASRIVSLIGGSLGILAATGGAATFVVAYFATRNDLRVVDCYQYYAADSLSAQTDQIRLVPEYSDSVQKAAAAKIAYEREPGNSVLLAAFHEAVQTQDEKLKALQDAQGRSKTALQEQGKCGYQGPGRF